MEFLVDTYKDKYIISSYSNEENVMQYSGSPFIFQEDWGIPAGVVRDIFDSHKTTHDGIFLFPTKANADSALLMLSLLRRR